MHRIVFHNLLLMVFATFLVAVVFFSQGCNDKPTEIGETLVTDTVIVSSFNSYEFPVITGDRQEKVAVSIFNANALFVGKFEDYEALSFIRFPNLPDSLSYLDEQSIEYVKLKVFPDFYSFGDTIENNLSFNVHKVQKLFTNLTSYDSIAESTEKYWNDRILASYTGKITAQNDTLFPLELNLDKSIVAEWAASLKDSITATMNYGLALIPKEESSYIRKFFSQVVGSVNPRPSIEIVYKNKNNKSDTIWLLSANDLSVVKGKPAEESMITVQGVISYKSKLYFDVSILPPLAAVHHAELVLTLDESKSQWGNQGPDKVLQADLLSDTVITSSIARYFQGERTENTNKYVFKTIAAAVEIWNRRNGTGFLVLTPLGSDNIYRSIERMVFYGTSEPDSTKRPYLKVVYSQRPDFGKQR